MLRFNAVRFVEIMEALQGSRALMRRNVEVNPNHEEFSSQDLESLRLIAQALASSAGDLGTPLTKLAAERLESKIPRRKKGSKFLRKDALRELDSLHERLCDETSLIHLFVMDAATRRYFGTDGLAFGEHVADALSQAIPDIIDAGDCIALKKGTASVFHLMRVMEAALKALGKLLDIPYAPSWESYINQIEGKITARHKTKSIKWKRDEAFYREILGDLQTVKLAWRNPTMHIVRRYSADEAEQIYVAVKAFLERLAPRLPKPKLTKLSMSTSEGT
jgi:hypothetical protein